MLNIAKKIKGPAVITYKQATFFSQDDIALDMSPSLIDIQSSAFGAVDQRIDDFQATIGLTPMGIWGDLGVLFPYASRALGASLAAKYKISAVTVVSDQLTKVAHAIVDGTPVRAYSIGGVVPSGLSEATLYYAKAFDVDNVTLHPTQADGIAGTNTVDITADDGTGDLYLIEQEPLVIQSLEDGETLTYHNAVITQMPNISFGATKQLFGGLALEAFPKFGVDRVDADSVYSTGNAALSASFNPASVITQPYTMAWGAAPWDSLQTKEGLQMNFSMATSNDQADSIGTGMKSLQDLSVEVVGQPIGITVGQLLAKLKLQGAGAVRGASLTGDDLNIVGTGIYARLYNASLSKGALAYSSQNDRISPLTWKATRTMTAGVADPLFYVGSGAPV